MKAKFFVAAVIAVAIGSAVWSSWTKTFTYKNAVKPACSIIVRDGPAYTVCTYDPALHSFELVTYAKDGAPLRNFARLSKLLGKKSKNVVFAMNAGMYDDAGRAIGLYVENQKERVPVNQRSAEGNFYLKPNGVFWIDASGAHIDTTQDFAATSDVSPIWATQSGPMLVVDGTVNTHFSSDGPSRYTRNGVCLTASKTALFVISETEISLGTFAAFMRFALHCDDALYLDGAVSSLWDGASGRNDQKYPLGPMLVVTQRQAR